jgi:co-chaperonin GroES (HSP10)
LRESREAPPPVWGNAWRGSSNTSHINSTPTSECQAKKSPLSLDNPRNPCYDLPMKQPIQPERWTDLGPDYPVSTEPRPTPSIDPFSLPTTYERITALIDQGRFQLLEAQLVARIDLRQSYGSILLPDQAQSETNTATIVCIASDLEGTDFKVGRKVLPIQHAGRELCSKGNERLVLYDTKEDLHAVFVD